MEITERNFKRIMGISDDSKRKAKLQEFCLSIGWHGGTWRDAMNELHKLNEAGVKTALEKAINA